MTQGLLHRLFEAQADRTPHAPAVSAGDTTLDYRQLDLSASRLAHRLRVLGVGPEVPVGICLPIGIEAVLAILAVLKAGGTYVPLDPSHPRERQAYLIEECRPAVTLTDSTVASSLPAGAPLLRLDTLDPDLADRPAAPREVGLVPDNAAYILFTSGSTGTPKGVVVSHAAVFNNIQWQCQRFALGPGDTTLQMYSLNFDASVLSLFWPLASGARLLLSRYSAPFDARELAHLIAAERVTTYAATPTQHKALLHHFRLRDATGVRYVESGGESLSLSLLEQLHAAMPAAQVVNLYGPTEATIDATAWCSAPAAVGAVSGRT